MARKTRAKPKAAPSPGPDPSTKTLKVRKYPNRRYYDTTRSCHVTLEELRALIQQGYDVEVTDSATGQDITAKVLAQILLEQDPVKLDIFPAAMLHRIIRANEQIVTEFVEKYFNQALSSFLASKQAYEDFLRRSMGLAGAGGGGEAPAGGGAGPEWMRWIMNPLAGNPWMATPPPPSPRPAEPPPGEADELKQTVADLRRELDELRRHVGRKRR